MHHAAFFRLRQGRHHTRRPSRPLGAAEGPVSTIAEIKEAFTTSGPSPHLCRCGSYTAIIEAVERAATVMAKGR